MFTPLPPQVKLHECQCDRQGRFWIGAYDHGFPANRESKGASFFRLDGDAADHQCPADRIGRGMGGERGDNGNGHAGHPELAAHAAR